jgi:acetyl esterase/lipase
MIDRSESIQERGFNRNPFLPLSLFMRLLLLAALLVASPAFAAESKIRKDIPYADPPNKRQMLDVYSPADAKDLPIIVWIHGGGWKAGDKAGMQKKPQAFNEKRFVFVSTTYRFVPEVTVKQMTGDCAKAIRWAHDHAKEIGGDPNRIIVMGHSAGAHLAALVCTDESYLKAEGLDLSILKGCVPVDVSVYDIPKRLKESGSVAPATFTAIFGDKEETQKDLSPAAHVAEGKHIPPFLLLHVASRPETKAQAEWFASNLKAAGISAKVYGAENKTHGTINSELGLPEDKATIEVFSFLDGVLKK